jgi:hypothetical protein
MGELIWVVAAMMGYVDAAVWRTELTREPVSPVVGAAGDYVRSFAFNDAPTVKIVVAAPRLEVSSVVTIALGQNAAENYCRLTYAFRTGVAAGTTCSLAGTTQSLITGKRFVVEPPGVFEIAAAGSGTQLVIERWTDSELDGHGSAFVFKGRSSAGKPASERTAIQVVGQRVRIKNLIIRYDFLTGISGQIVPDENGASFEMTDEAWNRFLDPDALGSATLDDIHSWVFDRIFQMNANDPRPYTSQAFERLRFDTVTTRVEHEIGDGSHRLRLFREQRNLLDKFTAGPAVLVRKRGASAVQVNGRAKTFGDTVFENHDITFEAVTIENAPNIAFIVTGARGVLLKSSRVLPGVDAISGQPQIFGTVAAFFRAAGAGGDIAVVGGTFNRRPMTPSTSMA